MQTLGFDESDSTEDTCAVSMNGGKLIFTAADLWPGQPHCTGTLYFFVDDVDAYYEAVSAKVEISWPLQDMSYGLREFGIIDINGYHIAFAQA